MRPKSMMSLNWHGKAKGGEDREESKNDDKLHRVGVQIRFYD